MFVFRAFSICLLGLVISASRLPDLPQLSLERFAPPIRKQIQEAYDAVVSRPRDSVATGRLGMFLYAYQQHHSAAVCFERAHTLDPQEFRWTYYLATVQAALGDPLRLLLRFGKAFGKSPTTNLHSSSWPKRCSPPVNLKRAVSSTNPSSTNIRTRHRRTMGWGE